VGARFSAPVQTSPGAHPASCTIGTGSFPGVKSGRGVTLTPHPLLVPWSRKSTAKPLLPPLGRTACTEPQCLYKCALYSSPDLRCFHTVLCTAQFVPELFPGGREAEVWHWPPTTIYCFQWPLRLLTRWVNIGASSDYVENRKRLVLVVGSHPFLSLSPQPGRLTDWAVVAPKGALVNRKWRRRRRRRWAVAMRWMLLTCLAFGDLLIRSQSTSIFSCFTPSHPAVRPLPHFSLEPWQNTSRSIRTRHCSPKTIYKICSLPLNPNLIQVKLKFHSPSYRAKVKNEWRYTSTPCIRLYGVGRATSSL